MAAVVRAELARRSKTTSDLAAHLGLSRQSVHRRVSGQQPFTIDELTAVAAYVGVPVTALLADPSQAGAA